MVFAPDTEVALAAAAALVNTEDDGGLETIADLDRFVADWQWTGTHRRTRAELAEVRALRPRLRGLWQQDEHRVVALVNELLREAHAMPQLVDHDDWGYHLHAWTPGTPLADRMAVEAAMAVADVVRARETDRMRICDGEDCRDVLVDLSRNRSRRFCDHGCGNRAHVAAYRARRSGAGVAAGTRGATSAD